VPRLPLGKILAKENPWHAICDTFDLKAAMTPEQIRLVQQSWRRILPIAGYAAEIFYFRLFTLDPSLRAVFRGDMQVQGRMLMVTINAAVFGLGSADRLLSTLRELESRHAGWGLQRSHYVVAGAAWLWTLGKGMGEGFTPEVREAWESAYRLLAGTMQDAGADAAIH
jgi:hemoglobin-like flavoprotein